MQMTLLCTRKARKRYPWSKHEVTRSPESSVPFMRWYCNSITVLRRPALLLVHEGSLFSVLLYPFHSDNVKSLIERFCHSLERVLPNESARENFVHVRDSITGFATQPAHDKSVLGSMVEIRWRFNWHLNDYSELDDQLLSEIGKRINDNPWVQRGFFSDEEFTRQLHEFVSAREVRR